jgi:Tripeptidyl peptidase II
MQHADISGLQVAECTEGCQRGLLMLGEYVALQGARDALPRGRTPHALTLTYKLSLVEGGKITPRLPMMNGWGTICHHSTTPINVLELTVASSKTWY